jgi:drug efflux transport system permease protein
MKRFYGFVKKEFFHIFRDVRTMLILFGMPAVQILLFGFVITNELKDAKIGILDYSRDDVTKEITNKILSSGYFVLDRYIDSPNQIEDIFKEGKVKEIIVFESNFSERLERENIADIQIIADASDANTANLMVNYTAGIIQDYLIKQNAEAASKFKIESKERFLFNESLQDEFMFVPGTMALILILISAMMTSISIAREKEMGTMEILLVSPLKPFQIIIGKVMPYIVLAFIDAVLVLAIGYFVFDVPIKGSLVLLLLLCLLYIILSLSLGIFISTIANTQQTAMFISMFVLMLPAMLLSGFIFPIENMHVILQTLCHVMPPTYFIIGIKDIMLKGVGFAVVWKEFLIIIGITVFFILMSVKKFKIRLE